MFAKSAEGENQFIYDGYVFNGQADSTTLNQITSQLILRVLVVKLIQLIALFDRFALSYVISGYIARMHGYNVIRVVRLYVCRACDCI